MNHENGTLTDRQPAFSPRELILPSGEYANKRSLQELCGDAGLPVLTILTESEVEDLWQEWVEEEIEDAIDYSDPKILAEYQTRLSNHRVFARSYVDRLDDGFAVDILPTERLNPGSSIELFQQTLDAVSRDPRLCRFLHNNFVQPPPEAQFFLQQAACQYMYISTWDHNTQTYCSMTAKQGEIGGSSWYSFDRESVVLLESSAHQRSWNGMIQKMVIPLARRASSAISGALSAKFDCKHDFIMTDDDEIYLIQSRIASRATNTESSQKDREKLSMLRKNNIPEHYIQTKELEMLMQWCDTSKPFILNLSNDNHDIYASMTAILSLNLSNMVALVLPKHLRGSMLEHRGYNVIAIALYWGIPLVME